MANENSFKNVKYLKKFNSPKGKPQMTKDETCYECQFYFEESESSHIYVRSCFPIKEKYGVTPIDPKIGELNINCHAERDKEVV